MVRKETIRKMVDMHTPPTRRPADRDRAVDRIRRLTVGTTVAGKMLFISNRFQVSCFSLVSGKQSATKATSLHL